eukprot:TRINITY_DN7824_c0_g2_i1.p1 TRINITY_DN7824_c0_g2~~TRINITY_DN7824_c0_g2_i1.p1  ORF type:complete len:311 (-),score=20.80 TRINITY_DN7824_c0_g2_i1:113-952(-)
MVTPDIRRKIFGALYKDDDALEMCLILTDLARDAHPHPRTDSSLNNNSSISSAQDDHHHRHTIHGLRLHRCADSIYLLIDDQNPFLSDPFFLFDGDINCSGSGSSSSNEINNHQQNHNFILRAYHGSSHCVYDDNDAKLTPHIINNIIDNVISTNERGKANMTLSLEWLFNSCEDWLRTILLSIIDFLCASYNYSTSNTIWPPYIEDMILPDYVDGFVRGIVKTSADTRPPGSYNNCTKTKEYEMTMGYFICSVKSFHHLHPLCLAALMLNIDLVCYIL